MAERGAAPARRALQARLPGGTGTPPGALRPPARSSQANDGRRYGGNAGAVPVRDRTAPELENAARSADGRSVPFAKGTRTPAKACNFLGANRRSAPRSSRANTRRATAGNTRRPPAGPTEAAADFAWADFAWLFDKVKPTRTVRGEARRVNILRFHLSPLAGRVDARSAYAAPVRR